MSNWLRSRCRQPEWIDAPDADPALLRKSLIYIQRLNRVLGYTRATLHHLNLFSRSWEPGQTIRLLDVATGSADIPRAIFKWGARRRFDLRIVGLDLHAATLCQAGCPVDPRLALVRGDAVRLPFSDNAFDYAICNMFLHHLDDDQIVGALREMSRVARRGLVAADILRHRRAYAWIVLLTLWANPMVRHDARVSVAQALTRSEVLRLRDRAGVGFASYHRHFGHRFVLAGEKK